jgi:uncharacterized membrane protein YfcA
MFYELITLLLPYIPFLILMGAAAGFLAGLLGIGGGVVLVPCLFYGFQWLEFSDQHVMHMAVATSFSINVFTAISSVRSHYKRDSISIRTFKQLFLGILFGVFIASFIISNISSETMQLIFAVVILILSVNMVLKRDIGIFKDLSSNFVKFLAGSFIGGISSLMGIGGAVMSVPFMQAIGVNMHKAVGTAAALGFVIALPALVAYIVFGYSQTDLPKFSFGYVYLPAWAVIIPVSTLMAPVGAYVAHSISAQKLSKVFAAYLALVALKMLYDII